eukprot:m51a1_g11445 hypothetical protein (328) ;mRNA; r:395-1770
MAERQLPHAAPSAARKASPETVRVAPLIDDAQAAAHSWPAASFEPGYAVAVFEELLPTWRVGRIAERLFWKGKPAGAALVRNLHVPTLWGKGGGSKTLVQWVLRPEEPPNESPDFSLVNVFLTLRTADIVGKNQWSAEAQPPVDHYGEPISNDFAMPRSRVLAETGVELPLQMWDARYFTAVRELGLALQIAHLPAEAAARLKAVRSRRKRAPSSSSSSPVVAVDSPRITPYERGLFSEEAAPAQRCPYSPLHEIPQNVATALGRAAAAAASTAQYSPGVFGGPPQCSSSSSSGLGNEQQLQSEAELAEFRLTPDEADAVKALRALK